MDLCILIWWLWIFRKRYPEWRRLEGRTDFSLRSGVFFFFSRVYLNRRLSWFWHFLCSSRNPCSFFANGNAWQAGKVVTTFVVLDWPFDFLEVRGYFLKLSCSTHTSARKTPRYDHFKKKKKHFRVISRTCREPVTRRKNVAHINVPRKNPNAWKVIKVCFYQIAVTPFLTPSQVP